MSKKLTSLSIGVGLLIVSLAACSAGNTASAAGNTDNAAESVSLDGTSWTLTAYGDTSPLPNTTIDITFEGGELSGSAGCNHYFGSYETSGNTISISDVSATEMFCTGPEGVMEQETAYLSALSAAKTFQISGGLLQIAGSGDDLTFAAQ
jgi:heat shock protein HslJ